MQPQPAPVLWPQAAAPLEIAEEPAEEAAEASGSADEAEEAAEASGSSADEAALAIVGASSSGAAASESLPRGPRHGARTWRSMTAISCRDLLLRMPEMGRASDEEIAYLPETALIIAGKQFRWIVETAISSARVQTLASQPMPTRTATATATLDDPLPLPAGGSTATGHGDSATAAPAAEKLVNVETVPKATRPLAMSLDWRRMVAMARAAAAAATLDAVAASQAAASAAAVATSAAAAAAAAASAASICEQLVAEMDDWLADLS